MNGATPTTQDTPDKGRLQINLVSDITAYPIQGARISISYTGIPETPLEQLTTDSSGQTDMIDLAAPPLEYSLDPENEIQPIRRYPDLQIHRIIKDNLRGRMNADKMEHYRSILPEVAKRSSEMERRADEAERETVKLKKVEYMQAHIGEEFEGVISGITKWGMYVELPNTIEGLVHVTNMTDDHYEYNEERYEMMGMHTRKVYKLGEGLRVRVLDADRLMRTIDFKIVNQGGAGDGEE